jgi:hypothetical protein
MYAEILLEAIAIQRGGFDTSIINYPAREQWNLGAVHPFGAARADVVGEDVDNPRSLYI